MSDALMNLPKNWVQVTVADLGKVVSGGTPSTKENSYWGGNISWISPSDLTGYSDKHISKGAKSITQAGLKNSSATIMPAGSIHFSSRAPIGYTVISSCEMTTNQGFKSLVPAQGVFNEYIYYYFKSAKQLAESRATGTTFKEISGAAFSKLPVPLAPTNEQHRIVAKIEELFSELDKGIENLKTAQAQLKVHRQALLKHAFEGKLTKEWREQHRDQLETAAALQQRIQQERAQRYQQQLADWEANGKQGSKPKAPKPLPPLTAEELAELPELPEGWGWVRLDEISEKITDGDHQAPPQTTEGVPFITISDIKNQRIDFSDTRYVSQTYFDDLSEMRKPVRDDILYTVTGSFGIPCLVDFDRDFCFQRHIGLIRSCKEISKKFLFYSLSSRNVYGQAVSVATGTAQKTVPLGGLRLFKIPLMSYEEQQQIASELEASLSEVDQLELTITTSLQQAEALRQSILKKAFSGQLVAQDANDEPASVLLARIQAERTVQSVKAKPRKPKQITADPAPEKSNTIPFPVRISNISATDLHAGILARAYQHHENAPKYLGNFGHVKAEKIAHMVEAYLGIDLERKPIKDAAGPNDYPHLMKVESRARKANWFDVKKKKDADAYAFSKKHGFDALLLKTMKALGERAEEVDALISLLLPLNSRQSEIVATLYAAWNNLLLQGQTPDDEAIVQEARENWHASKLKIERDKFFRGLRWMREHGLVPAGRGRFVAKKS